jgi:hypothetical protein
MSNQFLISRKPFIEQLKRQLVEYHYSGSYGGTIPLMQIVELFDGLMLEITRVQDELETMNKKYERALEGFKLNVEDDKETPQGEDKPDANPV